MDYPRDQVEHVCHSVAPFFRLAPNCRALGFTVLNTWVKEALQHAKRPLATSLRRASQMQIGHTSGLGCFESELRRPPAKCSLYRGGRYRMAIGRAQICAMSSISSESFVNGVHISLLSQPHWSTAVPRLDRLICFRSQGPVIEWRILGGKKLEAKWYQ